MCFITLITSYIWDCIWILKKKQHGVEQVAGDLVKTQIIS